MTVSVVGTSISAPVDSSSRFTLRDVPAGNPQFKFSSPSVDATLSLQTVDSNETISLAVSVTSSSATIESLGRSSGNAEQLEGRIESIPVTPAGSLIVAGRTVTTDTNTRIYQGSGQITFADLAVGQRVHVKGTPNATSLLASVIELQNTNVDIPVPINGIISNFTGTASSFEFQINGRTIKGDSATEFFGNSEFSDLANGKRAEVKGALREGYVYATRLKVETDDDDDDGQNSSASVEGLLSSITGAPPTLTLMIGTTTVTTTAATEVRRRGDVQDLSVLDEGMTVHAVGTRQSDGTIVARMLQIKDDAVGGLVEISGSAGGVKGTCPTLTFGVNGYNVVTDAATTFTPAPGCSALKSGNNVTVKGELQANGTVKATSVAKN